jgi:hypothetical protein
LRAALARSAAARTDEPQRSSRDFVVIARASRDGQSAGKPLGIGTEVVRGPRNLATCWRRNQSGRTSFGFGNGPLSPCPYSGSSPSDPGHSPRWPGFPFGRFGMSERFALGVTGFVLFDRGPRFSVDRLHDCKPCKKPPCRCV